MPDNAVPALDDARTYRQKVLACGLDPNYWYPVELSGAVKPSKVIETKFWKQSIALFRDAQGHLAAIENRCAHRQVRLSLGEVHGCHLVCPYHGWTYDAEGRVVEIPHDLFGREMPRFKIASYPVKERYGLIWIFPGDRALAAQRKIPVIEKLEGDHPWSCIPLQFDWQGHFSMVADNFADPSHHYLHRKYRPVLARGLTEAEYFKPTLIHYVSDGDRIEFSYQLKPGKGGYVGAFVGPAERAEIADNIRMKYEYPYLEIEVGANIKNSCFFVPIDERTTRFFFLTCLRSAVIPFTPWQVPRAMMPPVIKMVQALVLKSFLDQDGDAIEWEQLGYEAGPSAPFAELNPAIKLLQETYIRKWDEYQSSLPRRAGT